MKEEGTPTNVKPRDGERKKLARSRGYGRFAALSGAESAPNVDVNRIADKVNGTVGVDAVDSAAVTAARGNPRDVFGNAALVDDFVFVVFARTPQLFVVDATAVIVKHFVRICGVRRVIVGIERGQAGAPEDAARILTGVSTGRGLTL